ncbi:MAG TPA: molybdopterin-dependent oxidoreductase [Verrucomicrobiae bacterium]|nr:molybdopterin-dependent oxidoreductase [Verrucomicrobiae bacterium]
MKPPPPSNLITRRDFVRTTSALAATTLAGRLCSTTRAADATAPSPAKTAPSKPAGSAYPHPFLTPADEFRDVSRGDPKPHTLTGNALVQARLTPETWRLEIIAYETPNPAIKESAGLSKPLTLADGSALDLPALLELGKKHEVKFLKAMQCLNIPTPLGQGLWEGVPLRDVLRLCGTIRNVRRIYYWGFHNNDPRQLFQSSLSYTQAMETPPGELPAFLAYRLNGEPIPLIRGGPVRMIIPWAHGFKSIKWLQRIVVTNDYKANDTYAEQNNDPESHLKTAAYLDDLPAKIPAGQPLLISGLVISGLSGLKCVEYLLSRENSKPGAPTEHDAGQWIECRLEDPPADWGTVLPAGVSSRQVLGFDPNTGRPATWPLRYSMVSWSVTLKGLAPGRCAVRARAVDLNGFAQPEPRPNQKAGVNALDAREFEVV